MRRRVLVRPTIIGFLCVYLQSALSETFLEALVGGSTRMPCNVLPKEGDSVEFIFWYRNEGVTALYTLDARERRLADAAHTANDTYGPRVRFHVTHEPPYLQMDKLRPEDGGDYFCRVDYQWSATEITRVNLLVVIPPGKLVVREDTRREVERMAGPFTERTDATLSCEAHEGFPSPNLTWWRDDKLWDNTFQKTSSGVENEMRLVNLSRSDLFANFHCKAENTKLASPIVKTVVLDIWLYPLSVNIADKRRPYTAGKPTEVLCDSSGSRPPAKVTWWLNGSLLGEHSQTVRDNVTSSVLRLKPLAGLHGSVLTCKAENPKVRNSAVEDVKVLNVTYIPHVQLRLTKEEEGRHPREDDYVRLTCNVDSNPPLLKLGWLFNGLPLSHNQSRTDEVGGNTLAFKRLSRRDRGRYRCYAINDVGRGQSEELMLNISHAPVCKENQQVTYSVSLGDKVKVRCEVVAEPGNVTFKWEFSNTVRKHYNVSHASEGSVSSATYVPRTADDYGTLFCWANNSIGLQQSSCFFTVIAPAHPEQACKSENASASSARGSEEEWPQRAITATSVTISVFIVTAVCAFCLWRVYVEKKHRPIEQILEEEISIYSRVQCHNSEQPRILIAK